MDKMVFLSNIVHNTGTEKLKEFNSAIEKMNGNLKTLEESKKSLEPIFNEKEELNFISFLFTSFKLALECQKQVLDLVKGALNNNAVLLPKGVINPVIINNYVSSLHQISNLNGLVYPLAKTISENFEKYYSVLYKRHSSSVDIQKNCIATDFAQWLFNHPEVDQSIFKQDLILNNIASPIAIIEFTINLINNLWDNCLALQKIFETEINQIKEILKDSFTNKAPKNYQINLCIAHLRALSPEHIEVKKVFSENEDKTKFLNKTYYQIIENISKADFDPAQFKAFLLEKKEAWNQFSNQSDFYTCKIGSGNQHAGESPGGLELVPGTKPIANLDDVQGSGFQEVKDFLISIKSGDKWANLFLATSPSKSVDKTNVLLIGPPGCGKTEVLRSVAAQPDSIGIFVQGSDFLTCWKGEAEKNPKRLFELGLELQQDTGKHVHFLIDEIDSVLKKQELTGPGETNLTLEFQVLMDGVVRYPGLSVWGTTNYPDRIPPAMIRRFSKTLIVGELSPQDRVNLLKHFIGFMPTDQFTDVVWQQASAKLDGATGEVIRKIADHVWRIKMNHFVKEKPQQAEEMLNYLNSNGKFDLKSFSKEQREEFNKKLKNYLVVLPADLIKSIDLHLQNISVVNEINFAKGTYEQAKKFLQANQKGI